MATISSIRQEQKPQTGRQTLTRVLSTKIWPKARFNKDKRSMRQEESIRDDKTFSQIKTETLNIDCLSSFAVWLKVLSSNLDSCCLMLPWSSLELACHLFFNHTRQCVCVPVWDSSCRLIKGIVLASRPLASHASLVWPSARLFLIRSGAMVVYLSGASLVVWSRVLWSHVGSCCLMLLLFLLEPAFGQPSF